MGSSKPEGNLSRILLNVDTLFMFRILPFLLKAILPEMMLPPGLLSCALVLVRFDTVVFLGTLISPCCGRICPDSEESQIREVMLLSAIC